MDKNIMKEKTSEFILNDIINEYIEEICYVRKKEETEKKNEDGKSDAWEAKLNANPEHPVIWILIGECKNNQRKCVQVGRNTRRINAWKNDIRQDRNIIKNGSTENNSRVTSRVNRYSKLLDEFNKVTFYEVDVDKYLTKCSDEYTSELMIYISNSRPEMITKAYNIFKVAFAEGKLAYDLGCDNYWNGAGGIEQYIFDYYINKQNTKEQKERLFVAKKE